MLEAFIRVICAIRSLFGLPCDDWSPTLPYGGTDGDIHDAKDEK